jgi:S1-C subfamily serine protease
MQISAPVQPGNSGGPVFDRAGAIVGVVVSKLNVERLFRATGDIAQNVNFAIKPQILRLFLEANQIQSLGATRGPPLDAVALASRARNVTVQVLCSQ